MSDEHLVLLVEDDEGHARLVNLAFKRKRDIFRVKRAASIEEARHFLSNQQPDIILADLLLPDGRGIDLLDPEALDQPYPLVIMTSHGDERVAVETMKAGALDYVVKSPAAFEEMPHLVQRALREWNHILERKRAEEELKRLNSQLEHANKKLEKLANFDSLTGIANRRNFMETFENEWKRACRNNLPVSLIMIDVDFFKSFNDNYGHQAGDECLKKIASILGRSLTRTGDFLARYGGEEFVVILPATDIHGSSSVAERLRQEVEEAQMPHGVSEISEYITISLGTATTLPHNSMSPSGLIAAADEALYKAKRTGRNRCVCS